MFGIFGALAVILAAIGLYGVVSLAVTQRTRELGVRIALGAQRGDVVRHVMRQGMLVVTVGATLGIAAAILAGPTVEPMLFQVSAREPAIYAAVVGLLLVVAIAASIVPSWRATRVDPAVALRSE
jgi:putative ABC transport system permease protein